jgi:hypothetical protein
VELARIAAEPLLERGGGVEEEVDLVPLEGLQA